MATRTSRRTGAVLAALALAGFAGCATTPGTDDAARDETGAIAEESSVGVFRLREGDCVQVPSDDELAVGITEMEAVPCDLPHDGEVLALIELPDGPDAPFPGEEAVFATSQDVCIERFDAVTGLDYATDPDWGLTTLYPSESTWSIIGDREVVCLAVPYTGGQISVTLPRI